ncbi:MAG: IPExxxVDY family protein [Sphingobacteriaceae bacterium]|nr:IPExxxVDY family protein [Sphingobacteriaceae bacterium]
MAKYVLNNSEENFNFLLFGIISEENQYSIVSKINRTLVIDLALSDNISYNLKPGNVFSFSLFKYFDEELGLEINLIANVSNLETQKSQEGKADDLFSGTAVEESAKLIKELPKINYFILIKGEDLHLYKFKIADKLKSIKEILQIQHIEPQQLSSRSNLVF